MKAGEKKFYPRPRQLSVPLARLGFSCLKLVPRGSVADVLPWLARGWRRTRPRGADSRREGRKRPRE